MPISYCRCEPRATPAQDRGSLRHTKQVPRHAGTGSLTLLNCHRARSARSTRSKVVSGGTVPPGTFVLIAPGSIPRSLLRAFNFEIWKLKCLGACPEDLYFEVHDEAYDKVWECILLKRGSLRQRMEGSSDTSGSSSSALSKLGSRK